MERAANYVQDVCDVCALVDGDHTVKSVVYCSKCDANLCDRCWGKPGRRARAWLLRGMGRGKGRRRG